MNCLTAHTESVITLPTPDDNSKMDTSSIGCGASRAAKTYPFALTGVANLEVQSVSTHNELNSKL